MRTENKEFLTGISNLYDLFLASIEAAERMIVITQQSESAKKMREDDIGCFMREYQTVTAHGVRQCGKTTWIAKTATPNTLVLHFGEEQLNNFNNTNPAIAGVHLTRHEFMQLLATPRILSRFASAAHSDSGFNMVIIDDAFYGDTRPQTVIAEIAKLMNANKDIAGTIFNDPVFYLIG